LTWAPDSATLVMYRTEPGDNKEVHMIETSPKDQLAAKLHTRPYPRPGDKFALHEIYVLDIENKKPIKVDVERIDYGRLPLLRWSKDSRHFTFEKTDRGHQRFRVVEVETGTARPAISLTRRPTLSSGLSMPQKSMKSPASISAIWMRPMKFSSHRSATAGSIST